MSEQTPSSKSSADAEHFFTSARELSPSFAVIDDERREEWDDEDGPLAYARISFLAWHLASLAERGELAEVIKVLDLAEVKMLSADAFTRELMVVGLLEDLQNASLQTDGRVRLVDIRALLGPASMAAWDDLMRCWHGTGPDARARLPPGSLPDDAPS